MSIDHKTGLQLRSLIKKSGELELSLAEVATPEPAADEVVVRVEASPINPSDLGLLVGAADMSTAKASGTKDSPVITAKVPEAAMNAMAGRLDESMPVGNEGAGVVVKTGSLDAAKALMGKTVAMIGGAMYSQYRCLKVSECLPLPAGITPAEGASCFVNPLTALGMTETMRREGHKALVHTAAASNLGQMLNKICLKDGIGLVNIVRSQEQADILRTIGALSGRWSKPARRWRSMPSAAASLPARSSLAWRSPPTRPQKSTAATDRACTSRSISMAPWIRVRSS